MEKDLYKVLGVDRNASDKDISKAYKKLCLKYHPDKQVGKSDKEKKEAEDKFKEVAAAYEVLSDKDKKMQYDTFGTVGGNHSSGWNTSDFGGFGGWEDVFSSMFGGNRRQQHTPTAAPGRDIRMNIPLSIEDIFNGCTKKVRYRKQVRCAVCHGEGGTGVRFCTECGGTGQVMHTTRTAFGMTQQIMPCPKCKGTGKTVDHVCQTCKGTGFKDVEEIIELTFPAGIQNGNGMRYTGKGSESKSKSGANGDFISIAVYNIDNDKYVIDGYNVLEVLYIPYYDVLLGCDYTVTLPNGKQHTIHIESCTPQGKVIPLYKCGIAGKGDYYFEIRYQYPDHISDSDRKALEQLKVNAVTSKA